MKDDSVRHIKYLVICLDEPFGSLCVGDLGLFMDYREIAHHEEELFKEGEPVIEVDVFGSPQNELGKYLEAV